MSIRGWFNEWRGDFKYTTRSLMREPLVSVVIVVTLALGIGANATMFGIIDRLLLRGPSQIVKPDDVKQTMHDVWSSSAAAQVATAMADSVRVVA